jgi:hypothetical protein
MSEEKAESTSNINISGDTVKQALADLVKRQEWR